MKRLLAMILGIALVAMLLCGCGETPAETTPAGTTPAETPAETTAAPVPTETTGVTPETCTHEYDRTLVKAATFKEEGLAHFACPICGDSYDEAIPVKTSLSVLAIGNSFSEDAREYLWDLCTAAGVEEVTIGALYSGGCSLDTHWLYMDANLPAYDYYENLVGTWASKRVSTVKAALQKYDWDVITVQQVSQNSGMPETYGNLQNILDYVNENKTNPDAQIYWHMTWAYQGDSTHSGFAYYGGSQSKMYAAIVDTVQSTVLTNPAIAGVIPAGTAIQNLRTSDLGDTLTRDGYHMSYDIGRYTVGLTWVKALTGLDIDDINWTSSKCAPVASHLAAIKEAVNAAIEKPFEVTQSSHAKTVKSLEMTDADKAKIKAAGYDPDNYYVLDWEPVVGSYYNSTSNSSRVTAGASNVPFFTSSPIYGKDDLPVGTIITVDSGYQYRPEGWTTLSVKTTQRPNNETAATVVVTNAWWGKFTYRAFNLSYVGSNKNMTAADSAHLRIYVPKTAVKVDEPTPEVLTEEDFDLTKYTKIDWSPVVGSYYNSTSNSNRVTAGATNVPFFTSSKMFTKTDLPVGTIIVVDSGYQYRPEGWKGLSTKTSSRPGNVTTNVVVVDDAWWGTFDHRAFNLSYIGSTTNMKESDSAHLRIYVPKQ